MQTIRQMIVTLLSKHEMDARELSQELGIREREVYTHLIHVARSVKGEKKKLIVYPSQCLRCGYVFEERKRFTRPGRCPQCKKSHLTRPMFQIK